APSASDPSAPRAPAESRGSGRRAPCRGTPRRPRPRPGRASPRSTIRRAGDRWASAAWPDRPRGRSSRRGRNSRRRFRSRTRMPAARREAGPARSTGAAPPRTASRRGGRPSGGADARGLAISFVEGPRFLETADGAWNRAVVLVHPLVVLRDLRQQPALFVLLVVRQALEVAGIPLQIAQRRGLPVVRRAAQRVARHTVAHGRQVMEVRALRLRDALAPVEPEVRLEMQAAQDVAESPVREVPVVEG